MPDLSLDELADIESALVAAFDAADHEPHTPEQVQRMQAAHDLAQAIRERGGSQSPSRRSSAHVPLANHPSRGSLVSPDRRSSTTSAVVRSAAGLDVPSAEALVGLLTETLNRKRTTGPEGTIVASASWNYPENRRLSEADSAANAAKLEAVTGLAALSASGGICGPVNVDYSVLTFAVADRPVRDALPAFSADRGGVRFTTPAQLSAAAGAVGVWSAATDANPAGATKPRLSVICGAEQVVLVDALPLRMLVGNLQARFYPEQVAEWLTLALANQARLAETTLLSKISGKSTPVSTSQLLGTTRDLLATVDQAVAAFRYRQRVPRTIRLRAVLPEFAKDMIRADLARTAFQDTDPLAVTDAQIESWFVARGVAPTWTMDSLSAQASSPGVIGYPLQGFGTQGANAALLDWPRTMTWWLWPEGTFQFLDGGTLDIGVVRDSLLNATNDYEVFLESFEGLLFRGIEAYQLVSNVRPNGTAASTVSTAGY